MLRLDDSGGCFACGPKNPQGLHLQFRMSDEETLTDFVPAEHHQGFEGIVHGGILATVLDEAMANSLWLRSIRAVTAEMKISFHKPARVGERLTITGRIVQDHGRLILCEARAKRDDGALVASAEGKFVRIA